MYAIIYTGFDALRALSMTRKYQSCLGNDHWTTVKNILNYVNRFKDKFMVFQGVFELCVKVTHILNFK